MRCGQQQEALTIQNKGGGENAFKPLLWAPRLSPACRCVCPPPTRLCARCLRGYGNVNQQLLL